MHKCLPNKQYNIWLSILINGLLTALNGLNWTQNQFSASLCDSQNFSKWDKRLIAYRLIAAIIDNVQSLPNTSANYYGTVEALLMDSCLNEQLP